MQTPGASGGALRYASGDCVARARHRYHWRKIHPRGGSLPEQTHAIVPGSVR